MERDNGVEKKRGAGSGKDPSLRLRIPTLIMAFFLACVAIATAYLAGVMSGRNSQPSSVEQSAAPRANSAQVPVKGDVEGEADKKQNMDASILSAEELEYARVLRRDENAPLSRLKGSSEKNASAGERDSDGQNNAPVAQESSPRPSLQKTLEAETSGETVDYIFQVGAFKDEKTVDNLREKLEGHGLRTMMQREGKLYLVLVRLRGTAARAAELVGLFTELGLGEPILRSRSPVKP